MTQYIDGPTVIVNGPGKQAFAYAGTNPSFSVEILVSKKKGAGGLRLVMLGGGILDVADSTPRSERGPTTYGFIGFIGHFDYREELESIVIKMNRVPYADGSNTGITAGRETTSNSLSNSFTRHHQLQEIERHRLRVQLVWGVFDPTEGGSRKGFIAPAENYKEARGQLFAYLDCRQNEGIRKELREMLGF